jgi:hypothetical protein
MQRVRFANIACDASIAVGGFCSEREVLVAQVKDSRAVISGGHAPARWNLICIGGREG